MTTLLVGRSYQESLKFAKSADLKNTRYAHSASAITSFRPDLILVLDSFWKRADYRPILSLILRAVDRYGVIAMEVHYEKPQPPAPGEPGYQADMLFGDVSNVRIPSPDDLRAVGATEEEVALLHPSEEVIDKIEADLAAVERPQDVVPEPVQDVVPDADPEERVNAPKDSAGKENKGSGRDEDSVPEATKPAQIAAEPVQVNPETVEKLKKKGRRTKEQLAYDKAVEAMEAGNGSLAEVRKARTALAKRHPNDERLEANKPKTVTSEVDDLFED